jgi:ribosome maturation factor RimP
MVRSLSEKIEKDLESTAAEFGCSIAYVSLSGFARKKTLRIVIEKLNEEPVDVGDCERLSKAFSVILDVIDPIRGSYDLEVSSPGIDRPLVKKEDFKRFVGSKVVVKLRQAANGQRIFRGLLSSASEDGIVIVAGCEVSEFDYESIGSANIDCGGIAR